FGNEAAEKLTEAREMVASCLGAKAGEIYFTSGGSEADNQVIRSAAFYGAKKGKKHLISTKFEHHAVLHTLDKLKKHGFEVTLLDVHEDGLVRVDELKAALREDTALVTIMFANNEIGTVQPIAEIGAICREAGIPFHVDAVQAIGHVHVNVEEQNIDMLSLSGHKFHGPKGVGALYVRRGSILLKNLIEGGGQEKGKRAGTENLGGIYSMAVAMKESVDNLEANTAKVLPMRERLLDGILKIEKTILNGDRNQRLPGNINVCFRGIEGEGMLLYLDMFGIAGSSGSACTSGSLDPSHVLLSLGLPHEIAHGSLRLSLSEYNTDEEVDYVLEKLPQVIAKLRAMSPIWKSIQEET
ncbi:MAG: aminotransferase class V-fold PLP-dependent enzyme, partial [Eubacteriales bacterium]